MTASRPERPLEHRDVRGLDAEAWLERLKRSVHEPVQDGLRYGGFPDEEVQRWFVGSSAEHALDEAFKFYSFTREHLQRRPAAKRAADRYLDFGCGWGRIGRFFLRDFERGDMVGVDVDPQIIHVCNSVGVPGSFLSIANREPLPFADESFELVTAYSVFTHLPADLFRFWMDELLRVTARSGLVCFTVEPPRFLDFVAAIDPAAPESGWHAKLHATLGDVAARRRELAEAGLTYLPTGGGGTHRQDDVYGDTVVTPAFLEQVVRPRGRIRAYVDEPWRFWQAVVLAQRVR